MSNKSQPKTWDRFNRWNQRDRGMSRVWVRKLCQRARDEGWVNETSNVLDYGCGYFDVGLALAPLIRRVDGYDPFLPSVDVARQDLEKLPDAHLYTDQSEIPEHAYDLVIVNSVVQYLSDFSEFQAGLAFKKDCLRPAQESKIVISDIMPKKYRAARDAVESLAYAFGHGVGTAMLSNVLKAALFTRGKRYLKMDPEDVERAAGATGLHVTVLDENLTPSKRRYTCILSPA